MDCRPAPAPTTPELRPGPRGGLAASYSVLRITDHLGVVRYEAVETRLVRERELVVQNAYLKAARAWKPGSDPSSPQQQPQKPEVRIWRTVMGGPDAIERAEAAAADCRKKECKDQPKAPSELPKAPVEPSKAPAQPLKGLPAPLVK